MNCSSTNVFYPKICFFLDFLRLFPLKALFLQSEYYLLLEDTQKSKTKNGVSRLHNYNYKSFSIFLFASTITLFSNEARYI